MSIRQIISEMSLEEKVGQLFQIGFTSITITPEIKEMINKYHVGGIIYFSRNIESPKQVATLSRDLQETAKIPLLISTDQEGGIVTRFSGATHFPGNMTLGATGDAELAFQTGETVARELKAGGINMNLAPVLDINNNPENPVIGVRSFGKDPELVARLGTAFIRGMQGEGVIACAKHFPGHGDTATDSHLDLPIIKHDKSWLEEVEFYPFKKAIKAGVDSIMTAHIYFPAIEPEERIPTTLSARVLTGLLREKLDYQGLIVTDCMEMNAIVKTTGTVAGAIKTIEAGSDMVLISHTLEKQKMAIEALIQAVRSGRILEERIEESVVRILELKEKRIGLSRESVNKPVLSTKEGEELAYQIARKGVTLVKNEEGLIPVDPLSRIRVMLLDFAMGRITMVEDRQKQGYFLTDSLRETGLQVDYYALTEDKLEIPSLQGFNLVIICTYDAVHHPRQVEVIKNLQTRRIPLIVLALRNPFDLRVLPGISTFLTTYDFSPANLKVASEIITGQYQAQGKLPVNIS